jgi:hypothetical protein
MVDCLVRYDRATGRHVLEVVDSFAANTTATTGDAKIAAPPVVRRGGASRERPMAGTYDPRSSAKRADDQIRKLRAGRGRAATSKTRK